MAPEGTTAAAAPTSLVSPPRVQKKCRIMTPLTSFQAIKVAHTLPACEPKLGVGPLVQLFPLRLAGGPSLSDLISQANTVVVSSSMLPLVFTTVVVETPNSVTTPLFSSSTPVSLFDSPVGVFSASEKEIPTTFVGGESTSARVATVSDAGGSTSGFVDDGARLGDDLYLPTICWDPNAQDKRYQPKWKIPESSRESRFVSEKNKAEEDLKRVIANLAEERILWARDIADKDRVLSHAKAVQEKPERKAVTEV
ncbi:hypothetical protein Hanom_Chr03g00197061 [Helianthus anomalus]